MVQLSNSEHCYVVLKDTEHLSISNYLNHAIDFKIRISGQRGHKVAEDTWLVSKSSGPEL